MQDFEISESNACFAFVENPPSWIVEIISLNAKLVEIKSAPNTTLMPIYLSKQMKERERKK